MAEQARLQDHALVDALCKHGARFGFFEAVRMLQIAHPDAAPVGHQGPPGQEVVRFRPPLNLSFGATDISEVWADGDRKRYEIVCSFMSLYGTPSPLPVCFTEELLYDDVHGLLREFIDIFNHRLISLFYRAWEKYRHCIQYDGSGDDPMTRRARILAHLERPGEPVGLLRFAGLLHQQPLSEHSMERVLRSVLDVPIAVRSCTMRWTEIPEHQRSSLGRSSCVLGGMAPLGSELRDVTTTFTVAVGPLTHRQHLEFLPGGRRCEALHSLIARMNTELDCELILEVAPAETSAYQLGNDHGGLGWTSWLGEDTPQRVDEFGDNLLKITQRSTPETKVA